MRLFFPAASILSACLLMGALSVAFAATPEQALIEEAKRMDSLAGTPRESQLAATITSEFKGFAGSYGNASNLLSGLRQGGAITLTKPNCAGISFAPAMGRMGYGDVFIALSLVRQNLLEQGVVRPCPEQIMAALVGNQGVLKLRSQGLGWGQVADVTGAPLGRVIDSVNSANKDLDRSGANYGGANPKDMPADQVGGNPSPVETALQTPPGAGNPPSVGNPNPIQPAPPPSGIGPQSQDKGFTPPGCPPVCGSISGQGNPKGHDLSEGASGRPGAGPKELLPQTGNPRPEIPKTETIRPDIAKPEGSVGAERPSVIRPDRPTLPDKSIRPEVIRPEMVRPELVRPETVRPELVRPEVVRPEARPQVIRPEVVRPEVRPEVLQRVDKPISIRPDIPREVIRLEPRSQVVRPEVLQREIRR